MNESFVKHSRAHAESALVWQKSFEFKLNSNKQKNAIKFQEQ